MQFNIISLLALAMAFTAMAAPVPVQVAGMAGELAKKDNLEARGGSGGDCLRC